MIQFMIMPLDGARRRHPDAVYLQRIGALLGVLRVGNQPLIEEIKAEIERITGEKYSILRSELLPAAVPEDEAEVRARTFELTIMALEARMPDAAD